MRRQTEFDLTKIPNCMNCLNGEPLGLFVFCQDAKARSLYGTKHWKQDRFICNYHRRIDDGDSVADA